jgi:hypothetical protein
MDWQLGTLAETFLPMYRGLIRERLGATDVEPAHNAPRGSSKCSTTRSPGTDTSTDPN